MLSLQKLTLSLVNNDISKAEEKAYSIRLYGVQLTNATFNLIKKLNSSDYGNEIQSPFHTP